jgi:hypothetical protein
VIVISDEFVTLDTPYGPQISHGGGENQRKVRVGHYTLPTRRRWSVNAAFTRGRRYVCCCATPALLRT